MTQRNEEGKTEYEYDEEYEDEYEEETPKKPGGKTTSRSKKTAKEKSRIGGASQVSNNNNPNLPEDSETGYSQPFLSTKRKQGQ